MVIPTTINVPNPQRIKAISYEVHYNGFGSTHAIYILMIIAAVLISFAICITVYNIKNIRK